jgi:hypothetical protein
MLLCLDICGPPGDIRDTSDPLKRLPSRTFFHEPPTLGNQSVLLDNPEIGRLVRTYVGSVKPIREYGNY